MKTLSLGALAILLLVGKNCGREQHRPALRPAGPPPQIDSATLPVIPVHPESLQGVDESRIYHQLGPGAPPRLIARKDIEYPPDHRPWGGRPGVLIVEVVIPPDGRIARIRVLKGPQDKILNQALVSALQEWRFVPAKLYGEPVSVYYTFTIPVNVEKMES